MCMCGGTTCMGSKIIAYTIKFEEFTLHAFAGGGLYIQNPSSRTNYLRSYLQLLYTVLLYNIL